MALSDCEQCAPPTVQYPFVSFPEYLPSLSVCASVGLFAPSLRTCVICPKCNRGCHEYNTCTRPHAGRRTRSDTVKKSTVVRTLSP
jgi:hypothetical protein